jgi:putative heme-binding domain-containing protein
VWTLSRIGTPEAQAAIRGALADSDETVRQAAIHAVSVARDSAAMPQLLDVLRRGTPHNRRAAAEALGRLEQPAAIAPLLAVAGEELDRTLEHSVTFALIEIANAAETKARLASANPRTRRAALLALDQMPGGGLAPESVTELVTADDPLIRSTASWILARHADWATPLAPWIARQLATGAIAGSDAPVYVDLLSRWTGDAAIQELLAAQLLAADATRAERQTILEIMARTSAKTLPTPWVKPVAGLIAQGDRLVPAAIAVVRSLPPDMKQGGEAASELRAALVAAAAQSSLPIVVRLDALATVPGGIGELDPATFAFVRDNLAADAPISLRVAAADVLAKSRLDDAQLLALTDCIRSAGPLEIERLIAPYAKSNSAAVGRALIVALAECAALTNLRPETLQEMFKHYGANVQDESQALYTLLAAGADARKAKIEQFIALVPQADAGRGHAVFNSQKAACFNCHAIGYRGGNIGPDLTRIGQIRTERDLLESIVFPSASFVRSYEPLTVSTTDGKTYNGTLRQDSPAEIVLALNDKETVRIARDEIDQMLAGTVSIMPAGLDQQLSAEELADLVAFLRACK